MIQRVTWGWVAGAVLLGGSFLSPGSGRADEPIGSPPTAASRPASGERGFWYALAESVTGDVYADPSRWRPLSLGTFFTEGWDEPWVSPPPGGGGAPRQGWINAFDGVFYRLVIGTMNYADEPGGRGHSFDSGATLYLPFNERFEMRGDFPFITSTRQPNGDYHNAAGDMRVTPRFLLTETESFTQSFGVFFRLPTGDVMNGNQVASVAPTYEFWTNWWRGLVIRGGASLEAPYSHTGVRESGARTTFTGNLAAGYYFTEHDLTPIGDLVGYVATNVNTLTDNRGPNTTTLTFTPGFRTHMGRNWYLLGGVEVPATNPEPFNYRILGGLMKVF